MKFWRQSLTNKFRTSKCTNRNCDANNYAFDHKLSPKCKTPDSVEGKSVFYALRRFLNCAALKVQSVTESPQKKLAIKQKYEKHIRDEKKKSYKNTLHYQFFQRRNYENLQTSNFHSIDKNEMSNDLSWTIKMSWSLTT